MGSRRPGIDDSHTLYYNWDTVVLQGPRDANPLGSRHPQIDDLIQTHHSPELLSRGCHHTTGTPECLEAFEMSVQ